MEFFKKIKDSVYGPEYYGEVVKKPFLYSLKYYLLLVLIFSILMTAVVSVKIVPQIKSFADYFFSSAIQKYPAELEVVIKDGKASSNVEEPYFVNMPKKWEGGAHKYLLVIDTKTPSSIESFVDYQTACLLKETSLICYDNNDIKITSLKDFPNATINKDKVASWVNKITPLLRLAYPVLVIIIFCGIYLFYLWRLGYLLIFAFLVLIIAKIKKMGIGYGKSYQLGLHLLTMPILVTFLMDVVLKVMKTSPNIPYFFSIIFLISAIINLRRHDQLMVVPQAPGNVPDKL